MIIYESHVKWPLSNEDEAIWSSDICDECDHQAVSELGEMLAEAEAGYIFEELRHHPIRLVIIYNCKIDALKRLQKENKTAATCTILDALITKIEKEDRREHTTSFLIESY